MYEFFRPNEDDKLLTFSELSKQLQVTAATVRRWAFDGCRGTKLPVCQTTRGLCSTLEHYHQFILDMQPIQETF